MSSLTAGINLGVVSISGTVTAEDCIALYKTKNGNPMFNSSDTDAIQTYAYLKGIKFKDNDYINLYNIQKACNVNTGNALFVRTNNNEPFSIKEWKAPANMINGIPLLFAVLGTCVTYVTGEKFAIKIITEILTKKINLASINTENDYIDDRTEGIKCEVKKMLNKFQSLIRGTPASARQSEIEINWISMVINKNIMNKCDPKVRLSDIAQIHELIVLLLNNSEPKEYETNSFPLSQFAVNLVSMGVSIGVCHNGDTFVEGSSDKMIINYLTNRSADINKRIPITYLTKDRENEEYTLHPNPEPLICKLLWLKESLPGSYARTDNEYNTMVFSWQSGLETSKIFDVKIRKIFDPTREDIQIIGTFDLDDEDITNIDNPRIKAAKRMLGAVNGNLEHIAHIVHNVLKGSENDYESIMQLAARASNISDNYDNSNSACMFQQYMCFIHGLSWGVTRSLIINPSDNKCFAHINTNKTEMYKLEISMIADLCMGNMSSKNLLQWVSIEQFGDTIDLNIEKRSIGRWNNKVFSIFKFALVIEENDKECIKMFTKDIAPANIPKTSKGNIVAARTRLTVKSTISNKTVLGCIESKKPDISAIITIEPDYEEDTDGVVHVARTNGSIIDYIDVIETMVKMWTRITTSECIEGKKCSSTDKSVLQNAYSITPLSIIEGCIYMPDIRKCKGLVQVGNNAIWRYIAMGVLDDEKTILVNKCISCAYEATPEPKKKKKLMFIGGPEEEQIALPSVVEIET